ncbi:uncharacterized protein TNCV_3102211 [Trichonephila clavipes]|nr:uncharacterized protein TNCV_3102211 [Trichonephila clavipes]
MSPGSRCMSGNTCGCRMSWTYSWAAIVPWINTKGWPCIVDNGTPYHHTSCGKRPSSISVQSSFLVRGTTPNGGIDVGGVKGSPRNGCRDPKCNSAWRLRMVREDTGAPNESATFA